MKIITKKFLDGNLKGLTYTFKTFHGFELGKVYTECLTGNKYIITEVKEEETAISTATIK